MSVSTPARSDMRRSLLNSSTMGAPSPIRKSFAGANSTPMKPVDEEKERSDRRSFIVIQRRLTNITASSAGSPIIDAIPLMEENQIQDHLRICAKLFTENKISSKNAWKLHVIDVMRKIVSTNGGNVLQVAGTSLDIGAKVYGLRVDDVHAKSLQLASSMNKNNERAPVQEDGDDLNADASLSEPQRRRTGRRKTKKMAADKRNTIDRDGKTLFAPIKQIESVVFATKENIDICATDNLFTQRLPMKPGTREFMLMSDEKYWSLPPDTILNDCKSRDIDLPEIINSHLCAPFTDFEIGNWDPEEEEKLLGDQTSSHEPVLDERGLPIAELDGSINDIFEDQDNVPEDGVSDVEEQQQEEFQVQLHGQIANVVDAVPEENRIATDYGYNTLIKTSTGKYIDKLWAGPSHWKVKFVRRSTARFSGSTVQQVVKHTRKAKVPQKLDFSKMPEPRENYVLKRAPPTVAPEKITLPVPESELSFESFKSVTECLLTKTAVMHPLSKSKIPNTILEQRDYEVPGYNYDNLNDSLYCSQHNGDGDNGPMEHSLEEELPPAAQQQFLDDNLINAPELVSATHLQYAMQAKKMDMKRLKSAVWKCISGDPEHQTAVIRPTRFSNVYAKLPTLVTADMRKELTCHLAVVALLHLCNDNNLNLRQDANDGDFTIVKAVS